MGLYILKIQLPNGLKYEAREEEGGGDVREQRRPSRLSLYQGHVRGNKIKKESFGDVSPLPLPPVPLQVLRVR